MNQDDIIRMARESGHGVQLDDGGRWPWGWGTNMEKMTAFANLVLSSHKPLSDDQLRKIIEEQCALTGWKVPPTIQVARAVERAHGIGDEP